MKSLTGKFPLLRYCLFLLLNCFLFSGLISVPHPSEAAEPPVAESGAPSLDEQYNQAKFYFNQLGNSTKLSLDRENWLKGGENFRRLYLASPQSVLAPSCLFMLGRMYLEMFDRFSKQEDLDEAISYFNDTARLFSEHKLADDSYYAIGQLYLKNKNDPKQAALYFGKVVTDYPAGDLFGPSAEMLKKLSKEHDIPLPKVMMGSSQIDKLNYVLPVKYWSSRDYTRIVIVASGPVNYREQLLEKTADQPRRLFIDFKNSYIEPRYRAAIPIEDGLLRSIRTGQFSEDVVRVVLDIETLDNYKIYSLPDPFRVVIDVRGQSATTAQEPHGKQPPKLSSTITPAPPVAIDSIATPAPASSPAPREAVLDEVTPPLSPSPLPAAPAVVASPPPDPAEVTPPFKKISRTQKKIIVRNTPVSSEQEAKKKDPKAKPISLAQQLGLGVKRIVLDPGHGGKDPGAIANGIKEKDVVLAIAKSLQPILAKELGCEVFLTRTDDQFLTLEERTAIANTKEADLFVSLHVNAHPSDKVRGFETYFLNLTTNAEAMRVAARENATSTHQMSDLQDILSDILKNSKIAESSRLAKQVHEAMMSGLTAQKDFGKIKNLGVKQAPFYVLLGAQMPAILIEIAFISNKEDAGNLSSPLFITALSEHISVGIKSYINSITASL